MAAGSAASAVPDRFTSLDEARERAGLTVGELWLRYFALGGTSTAFELEAYLQHAIVPDAYEHDLIAHALNERYVELGVDYPLSYSDDNLDHGDPDRS